MKWMYIVLGIIGGLVPPAIFLITNYHRRDPNAILDLGLVFFSFGITILIIPVGIAGGLVVAVAVHLVYNRVSPNRRRSTFTRQPISPIVNPQSSSGKPESE